MPLPLSSNAQKSALMSGDVLIFSQCSIDLKKNVLLIGTTGTETRFLSEAELPECARLAYGAEGREDVRPDELADRELAEALQRSIQESGKKRLCGVCPTDLHVTQSFLLSSHFMFIFVKPEQLENGLFVLETLAFLKKTSFFFATVPLFSPFGRRDKCFMLTLFQLFDFDTRRTTCKRLELIWVFN